MFVYLFVILIRSQNPDHIISQRIIYSIAKDYNNNILIANYIYDINNSLFFV